MCGGKRWRCSVRRGVRRGPDYFNMLLENVKKLLPSDAVYLGGWMCQGRMPGSVRARFAAQLEQDPENANAKRMLENFDRALSHPDEADLAAAAFFSNGKLAGDTAAAESL
ncbi:MAG: flavodoxin family protein [Ruthenibacterium lactatiformans]